jgi:hypothetical protein
VVALKTEEVDGSYSTYALVFDMDTGKVLMSERLLLKGGKLEGIEFI